jgi:hypothetical protein
MPSMFLCVWCVWPYGVSVYVCPVYVAVCRLCLCVSGVCGRMPSICMCVRCMWPYAVYVYVCPVYLSVRELYLARCKVKESPEDDPFYECDRGPCQDFVVSDELPVISYAQ